MSESPINRAESGPALPPGYHRVKIGGARVIAGDAAIPFVESALERQGTLYDYAASQPMAEAIPGRSTVFVVPGPGGDRWLVRRLTHGGLLAPLTGDRFLRLGRPRPFNELLLSHRFRELGIPTPRVAAAAIYPSALIYRGEVAREFIVEADDLAACLFARDGRQRASRSEVMAAAGRLLRTLFQAAVVHRDLNLRNVLVTWSGGPAAQILDIEKCSIEPALSPAQRRRMIERFRRSARRFEERGGRQIEEAAWRAFHAAIESG